MEQVPITEVNLNGFAPAIDATCPYCGSIVGGGKIYMHDAVSLRIFNCMYCDKNFARRISLMAECTYYKIEEV